MDDFLLKLVQQLGVAGLVVFLGYKLLDRWVSQILAVAQQHLDATNKQAAAISELASGIKDTRDEQRDVILAVRVLAQKVDEQTGWVKELQDLVRGENRKGAAA